MEQVKKFWWIGAIALVLVLLVSWFALSNSVTNTGNKHEADLNAQYLDNQNYLSDCITKIRESASIVKGNTAAFDQIMTDAVKGRYDDPNSSAQGAVGRGQLFSALSEQYPDLSGNTQLFDKMLTVAVGCRTDYRGKQSAMASKLQAYDTWRTGSWTARTFASGFPNDNLVATIGTEEYTGKDALKKMRQIILVSDAAKAYETGQLQPEDPFGTQPPK